MTEFTDWEERAFAVIKKCRCGKPVDVANALCTECQVDALASHVEVLAEVVRGFDERLSAVEEEAASASNHVAWLESRRPGDVR